MPCRECTEDGQKLDSDKERYLCARGPRNPKLRCLPAWVKRPISKVWQKVLVDSSEIDHLVMPEDGDYLI